MPRTSGELDRSLVQGLAWTGGVRWLGQILSWGITVVVARLLSPTDYGLAGMASVYTGFTLLICEAGLTASLLRVRTTDPIAQAQLGGFAGLVGLGCCVASMLIATPLSLLYGEPVVRDLILASSLGFIPRGLQVLPRGLLARALDFRRLALIDGLEAVILAGATLAFALSGAGVWSLIGGSLTGAVGGSIASFVVSPQRLAWPGDWRRIGKDILFSSKVLGTQIAWYIYSNSDFAVIGALLGSRALGAYTLAWTIANMPVDRVSSLVSRVSPAYFAAMSDDRHELRRYVLHLTEGLALFTFPACLGLAIVADDLVSVVLGPAWHDAVLPLRALAIGAMLRSIFVVLPPVLVFTGRVEWNLRFSLICAVVLPVTFMIAAHWGILAVAATWIVVYPLLTIVILLHHAFEAVDLQGRDYASALRGPLCASLVMTLAILAFRLSLPPHPADLTRLLIEIALGVVVYSTGALLLSGPRIRRALALLRARAGDRSDAAASANGTRRALLVTYHFPPDPAVGGLRWRKLTRHGAERGWNYDVLALAPDHLGRIDAEGVADLPATTRVHPIPRPRLPIAELPSRCWRLLRPANGRAGAASPEGESKAAEQLRWRPTSVRDLARHYFAWLDRHRGIAWGEAAADRARALLRTGHYDVVISCGPPHPPHIPIRALARSAGIPYVLDLRDPWSLLQRLPEAVASPLWVAQARRDEREAIAAAALVLTTTDAHRDALRRVHPEARERIVTVQNGWDEDPVPALPAGPRFTIRYAGSIYLDRDPQLLFRAAARLIAAEGLRPEEFALEFMGDVGAHDGRPLSAIAEAEGIGAYVHCLPPAPRRTALEFLAGASMLVLLPQDSDLAIPAKVFEYLRFPSWLLVLAEARSATARLLVGTAADVIPPHDLEGILAVLTTRYRAHREGIRAPRPTDDPRFSRAAQAAILFDALDRIGAPAVVAVPTLAQQEA